MLVSLAHPAADEAKNEKAIILFTLIFEQLLQLLASTLQVLHN